MRHQGFHQIEVLDIAYLAARWPDRAAELGVHTEVKGEPATGRISGGGALVQMLIVPLLLVLAIFAIGISNLMI